jgi:hypothetical protein
MLMYYISHSSYNTYTWYIIMGIAGLRASASVAARLLAVVTAFTPGLAAQGPEQTTAGPMTATTAARPTSRVEPARGMLGSLVGTWRFEIWFAGNFGRVPDASGTRVVRALFDDLRLEWTEQLDRSQVQGKGIVGFDPSSDRFFSTAVYNVGSTPELMTGILDDAQPSITFSVMSVSPGATEPPLPSSTLAILDRDHFTWVAQDAAWRAVFTRRDTTP